MSIIQKMGRIKGLPTLILVCLFASIMFTGLPNNYLFAYLERILGLGDSERIRLHEIQRGSWVLVFEIQKGA